MASMDATTTAEAVGAGGSLLAVFALRKQVARLASCMWSWVRRHKRQHREFQVLHKEHQVCRVEFADLKEDVTAINAKVDTIIGLLGGGRHG